jgi:hypothetical protein
VSVGAQIDKFYQDVSENKCIWYGKSADGTALEFDVKDDKVSFPLWSSKSRIVRLKKLSPELLGGIEPVSISIEEFKKEILPILEEKGRLVNLNLSGKNLTGFDLELDSVIKNIDACAGNS